MMLAITCIIFTTLHESPVPHWTLSQYCSVMHSFGRIATSTVDPNGVLIGYLRLIKCNCRCGARLSIGLLSTSRFALYSARFYSLCARQMRSIARAFAWRSPLLIAIMSRSYSCASHIIGRL